MFILNHDSMQTDNNTKTLSQYIWYGRLYVSLRAVKVKWTHLLLLLILEGDSAYDLLETYRKAAISPKDAALSLCERFRIIK